MGTPWEDIGKPVFEEMLAEFGSVATITRESAAFDGDTGLPGTPETETIAANAFLTTASFPGSTWSAGGRAPAEAPFARFAIDADVLAGDTVSIDGSSYAVRRVVPWHGTALVAELDAA